MPHPRLTPAMRHVLERRARVSSPPLHTLPPVQARAAYEAASGVLEVPRATLRRVEDFTVPARDGHLLPARLYTDAADSCFWCSLSNKKPPARWLKLMILSVL